jgi:hypothetical protein
MSKKPAWLLKLASMEMAIASLSLLMAVIFVGTIAQARMGTFAAQQIYFNSFLVWADLGGVKIPVFPGGLLVGAVWMASLTAAFITRMRLSKRTVGIFISHAGLVLFLVGQFLTQRLAKESQMPIEVGQTVGYSENSRKAELVFKTSVDEKTDDVVAIPAGLLKPGPLSVPQLPFQIHVKSFFPNAELTMAQGQESSRATQGVGARVIAKPQAELLDDESVNNATALIDISEGGKSLGVWMASVALGSKQTFLAGGKEYEIEMRLARTYYPFSLTLKEFRHDRYPGTDIPKNFSSLVRIAHPAANEERDTLIYMNNPLRYEGKTFYQ